MQNGKFHIFLIPKIRISSQMEKIYYDILFWVLRVHTAHKSIVFYYHIRANKPPAVYKKIKVLSWWFIEIFPQFDQKSPRTFWVKKWWFIWILYKWRFNQEWQFNGADTVSIDKNRMITEIILTDTNLKKFPQMWLLMKSLIFQM